MDVQISLQDLAFNSLEQGSPNPGPWTIRNTPQPVRNSRRWVAGERPKLHLLLPITRITTWIIPHPTPTPAPWENCLPQNFLMPKRLGTAALEYMPRSGMLGYMVILFLIFWGASILFSIVAVPFYIPVNTCCFLRFFFNLSHPNRCEVVFNCDFDLHFHHNLWCWLSFSYAYWLFVYFPLPSFELGCYFFCCWVLGVLYIFWILIPYQVICKSFLLKSGLSFHFLDGALWDTKLFNFDEVQFKFSFIDFACGGISKKSLLNPMTGRFFPSILRFL